VYHQIFWLAMWQVRRMSLAYQNIWWCTLFNKELVYCDVNQSFLILLFVWEYVSFMMISCIFCYRRYCMMWRHLAPPPLWVSWDIVRLLELKFSRWYLCLGLKQDVIRKKTVILCPRMAFWMHVGNETVIVPNITMFLHYVSQWSGWICLWINRIVHCNNNIGTRSPFCCKKQNMPLKINLICITSALALFLRWHQPWNWGHENLDVFQSKSTFAALHYNE
jgi:hypothetical protein